MSSPFVWERLNAALIEGVLGRVISSELLDIRLCVFFFSSRRRHTRCSRDWSSDVCSSDLMEYNYEWFVNDLENPYSTPAGKPFTWQRLRVLGGRSLVWGRQSYRLSDADFKAASRDGYGDDWPISYADLAPYYDIVERYVGISGAAEGN